MDKVFHQNNLIKLIEKIDYKKDKTVVVGGCFDLLHSGHIAFLKAAKKSGNILIVLLESDQSIQKLKGEGRPIQNQLQRADVLARLSYTNFILLLDGIKKDDEYDKLILGLKPAIIATTEGDLSKHHKIRQAWKTGAKLINVIKRLPDYSTSNQIKNKI